MLFEISTTITQLLSALATKSVRPSGETATPSGVLPSGESGYSEVEIISRDPSGSRRAGTRLGFGSLGGARLDDVNRVIARAGHKQPAIGRQRHIVGPQPHGNVTDAPPLFRIHDAHASGHPNC